MTATINRMKQAITKAAAILEAEAQAAYQRLDTRAYLNIADARAALVRASHASSSHEAVHELRYATHVSRPFVSDEAAGLIALANMDAPRV